MSKNSRGVRDVHYLLQDAHGAPGGKQIEKQMSSSGASCEDPVYLARTIATAVKHFRHAMGISQSELALTMGCQQSRISQIERADTEQGWASINFICDLANRADFDTRMVFIPRKKDSGPLLDYKLNRCPARVEISMSASDKNRSAAKLLRAK